MSNMSDRPHIVYKAKVGKDGDQYYCMHGEDLVSGIVEFGNTPKQACENFDRLWNYGDKKAPTLMETCFGEKAKAQGHMSPKQSCDDMANAEESKEEKETSAKKERNYKDIYKEFLINSGITPLAMSYYRPCVSIQELISFPGSIVVYPKAGGRIIYTPTEAKVGKYNGEVYKPPKEKVSSAEIVLSTRSGWPYWSIKYFDLTDNQWHIGYSSYYKEYVEKWLNECFEIAGTPNVEENKYNHDILLKAKEELESGGGTYVKLEGN